MHEEGGIRREEAALYVVATPIGNLADITLRALDILRTVDVIAAEDTRVTARLLDHHGISARVISVRSHNEERGAHRVIGDIAGGRAVAYVTDAGTPGISDPGARLVEAVRAAGFRVVPVPGPSALAAALSVAGLRCPQVLFYGFLPAGAGARRGALEALRTGPHAIVFYEAPHRVVDCAADLAVVLGADRRVLVARELTKLFETLHACTLGELGAWLLADPNQQRGEFVLVVDGPPDDGDARAREAQRVLALLLEELPLSRAASLAARITGVSRGTLYQQALAIRSENPSASDT